MPAGRFASRVAARALIRRIHGDGKFTLRLLHVDLPPLAAARIQSFQSTNLASTE
jgi:hypothetical protein